MSDETASSKADADEALARMAAYGKKERKKSAWGSLVLFFVLLVPLAAAGWVAWRQLEMQNQLATLRADNAAVLEVAAGRPDAIAQVQQRLEALDAALQQRSAELDAALQALQQERQEQEDQQELATTLQQELAASKAAVATQAQRLERLETELGAVVARFAQTQLRANAAEAGGTPLVEAELLLRFAQQRLALARDTVTAVELYAAAANLLGTVDDPGVFAVRETLAQELAALQAVPAVDVDGIFAQLSAQAAQVGNFTAVAAGSVQDFAVTPAAADTTVPATDWWTGVKHALGNYFVVTQSSADIAPQLGATEQFQLRALVQLQIEQAKLALLQGEPELYRAALDGAVATAERWFQDAEGRLGEFTGALAALRARPIVVQVPETGQALAALRLFSGTGSPAQDATAPAPASAQ